MVTSETRYDAAVVGGGPAGSAAATRLARSGRSVLLLERQRFPRFHIGESMLPASNRMFAELGVEPAIREAGFVVKRGASFTTETGEIECYIDFSESSEVPRPVTFEVDRARLDELLLRHAEASGAEVLEEAAVAGVELSADGVELRYDHAGARHTAHARYLVDASGQSGFLARRLGLREVDERLQNVATHAWYEGIPRLPGDRAGDIRIVSLAELGWVWLIPIADDVMSVGLVEPRAVAANRPAGEDLDERLRSIDILGPALRNARRASPVRRDADYSYATRRYAGERWLLAGDAGSFLDPVFSSGVLLALQSGTEAARAVDRALDRPGKASSTLSAFDRRQRRRYRYFRRFAAGFYDPAFRDIFFSPAERGWVRRSVITALAGVWPPSLATRLGLRLFFLYVGVQRRITIAPRVHRALVGPDAHWRAGAAEHPREA